METIDTDLITRSSIQEMVTTWEHASAQIRTAIETINTADKALAGIFGKSGTGHCYNTTWKHLERAYNDADADSVVKARSRDIWQQLVHLTGIRKLMSEKRERELDRQLEREELPEITVDAVTGMLQQQHQSAETYIVESVTEVYNWLRPHDSYKTNSPFELGKKAIVHACEPGYSRDKPFRVSYYRQNHIRQLSAVFRALDNKEPGKTYNGELGDAINESKTGTGKTEYFKFKCFKNHNVHLEFLRPDLVAKFNTIAGSRQLKPENA